MVGRGIPTRGGEFPPTPHPPFGHLYMFANRGWRPVCKHVAAMTSDRPPRWPNLPQPQVQPMLGNKRALPPHLWRTLGRLVGCRQSRRVEEEATMTLAPGLPRVLFGIIPGKFFLTLRKNILNFFEQFRAPFFGSSFTQHNLSRLFRSCG